MSPSLSTPSAWPHRLGPFMSGAALARLAPPRTAPRAYARPANPRRSARIW